MNFLSLFQNTINSEAVAKTDLTKDWDALDETNLQELLQDSTMVKPIKSERLHLDGTKVYDGLPKIKRRFQQHNQKRERARTIVYLLFIPLLFAFYCVIPENNEIPSIKFNESTLANVIHDIESNYHVRIKVDESSILNCRISGMVFNMPPHDMLHVVARSLGVKLEMLKTGEYILSGKGCS